MIFNISKKCLCKMNKRLFYAFIISFLKFSSSRVITSTRVLQLWCSKIHYFSTLMLKNLTLFTIAFCVFELKIYKFNLPTPPPSLLSPSYSILFGPPPLPRPSGLHPTQNILPPLPSFIREVFRGSLRLSRAASSQESAGGREMRGRGQNKPRGHEVSEA